MYMKGTKELDKHIGEFREASAFTVTVGTNGEQGGDAGHGSRTYLRLGSDGADVEISTHDGGTGVTIEMGGDSELRTFVDALEFAAKTLRAVGGLK
jgi:hypothetical protein